MELVLAVDVSSSVSQQEYALQIMGLASAFRHHAVHGAIEQTGDLGIAVALVEWSGTYHQVLTLDWTLVADAASARAFAARIAGMRRPSVEFGTAIAGAVRFVMPLFHENAFCGQRQVIDVSGDGRENRSTRLPIVRDLAVASGLTINGLAILSDEIGLRRYYATNVIGGSGAFVITAASHDDFADAILAKLLREIAGAPIAGLPRGRERDG